MATLDQLPAEQRAIVELVVQRGRSYDALADVLQVPAERVRELARDALTELSPRTAQRVDSEWRGKVADYLLGQQAAGDARATRDYLKESEAARAWALSLLDSLDPLYPDGSQPAVPETAAAAAAPAAAAPETAEDRVRARERDRKKAEPEPEPEPEEEEAEEEKPAPVRRAKPAKPVRRPGALSPEAESALRRRRILGGVGAAVVLVGVVLAVLAIAGVFSSDDNGGGGSSASTSTTPSSTSTTAGQQPLQVLGQIALAPINGANAQGLAYIVQQGNKRFVVVQAKVPPLPNNQKVAAYEVWLYNSNSDARSLGAQYTDKNGILQGRAPLPADFAKFKFVDISRELFSDKDTGHGNASVLRGAFANIKQVPQQQGGTGTTPTTPTTPAP
jgi:hypothetical protein